MYKYIFEHLLNAGAKCNITFSWENGERKKQGRSEGREGERTPVGIFNKRSFRPLLQTAYRAWNMTTDFLGLWFSGWHNSYGSWHFSWFQSSDLYWFTLRALCAVAHLLGVLRHAPANVCMVSAVSSRQTEFDTSEITIFCWYDLLWLHSIVVACFN